MTRIIIAGDLCPKERVAQLFEEEQYESVLSEIRNAIQEADYAIVNLEAPIVSGKGTPIKKAGPNLKCGNKVIGAIKYAGFRCVTLANNHLCDYGEEGVVNTFNELGNNCISYVGAGENASDASRILYKTINGELFAFINCCEHEFSIATEATAGCNPLDVINQYHSIREAKKKANHVIVIVHGGIEMYQLPTPRMQKTYRFFIEVGADAVVNHHQHCFSGYEYYRGKPIVYGLGNFCFDWKGKNNSIWNDGYLLELLFEDAKIKISLIPYKQCDEIPSVSVTTIDKEGFDLKIKKLNSIISDEGELIKEYSKLLNGTWKNYDLINPYSNRILRKLYKNGLLPSLMPKKKYLSILNNIRCESHNDRLLFTLLKKIENI